MAAYAFARLEFTAKRWWFAIMLLTIMLPIHVIIVPQYVLFAQLGWVNTFLPLIVPKLLATDAFFVFLMVQFIRGVPIELDEAARIDGAGHPRIFAQIILPLMVPALATTAIFTFIWTWNDFFSQLIYLTDPDIYTVPLALRAFVDAQAGTNWGAALAMSVVSLVPIFLVFLFGQRFLLRGSPPPAASEPPQPFTATLHKGAIPCNADSSSRDPAPPPSPCRPGRLRHRRGRRRGTERRAGHHSHDLVGR